MINEEMKRTIEENPVFSAIENEIDHERKKQARRWNYTYSTSGDIAGGVTQQFTIQIEQGTDFKSIYLTGSVFSYDSENATDFPIPNSLGATAWAGRGLSMSITDAGAGRELTSGYVPIELLLTPGYGNNFQQPYPFRYYWRQNSQIRFDIRNRDSADRTHSFALALNGYKIAIA